ncbi:MAG TPA: ABC transporter ATP-binding protein [bacterium]|nr:ABC transporter ATP-binding protein [bacterium]
MPAAPPPSSPQAKRDASRRLWHLLLSQRGAFLLGAVGVLCTNTGKLLTFLLVGPFLEVVGRKNPTAAPGPAQQLVDRLFGRLLPDLPPAGQELSTEQLVAALSGVMAALGIALGIMVIGIGLQHYFIQAGVQRMLLDLRARLFRQTTALSLDYFERERTGHVISHVTTDIAALRGYASHALVQLLAQPVLLVLSFLVLVQLSPRLTVYSMAILPFLAVLFWQVGRRLRRTGRRSLEYQGELTTLLGETIAGLPVVKGFNLEEPAYEAFQRENLGSYKAELRKVRTRAVMQMISTVLGAAIVGILCIIGIRLVDFPTLVTFLMLLYTFSDAANKMGTQWSGYQEALSNADRIFTYLDLEPTVQDAPGAPALVPGPGEVRFEHVRFSYNGEPPWAIDGVSLEIAPGRTVALVGPSGSGKSSMAKLLLRFYDPQGGRILVDGQDIRTVTQESLRRTMAYVPQNTLLFSGTILSNIRFGKPGASMEEVERAARLANAHDFIMQMPGGYKTPVGERGTTLSGGQAQRISIARAILKDPKILILDEATSALDTQSEQLVQDALETLMKDRTTLVIAHRLSTIQDADEIVVMNQGRVMQRGSHEELFASTGMYRDLYQLGAMVE